MLLPLLASLLLGAAAPLAVAADTRPQPATAAASDEIQYIVQPDDTLLELARTRLDRPDRWRDLQQLNGVANPRRLQPGTTLRIPKAWIKPEAIAATIHRASNQVHVDGQPVKDGSTFKEGQTIRTGPDSTAVVTLPDGTTLRIPSATEVRLERLRAYHGAKDLDADFLLRHGTIEPDSPGKRTQPLRIKTPAGNAAVRGTYFRVKAQGGQSTIEVLRGAVDASNEHGTAAVEAGNAAIVTPTSKPDVTPLLPAPDLKALDGRVFEEPTALLPLPALTDAQAAAHHVEVSTQPDFSNVVLDTQTSAPDVSFLSKADGPHYVRVAQVSKRGIEGYNATASIEIAARRGIPVLQSQPETVLAAGPVTFLWTYTDPAGHEADAGRRYRVQIATDEGFQRIVHDVVVPVTQVKLYLGKNRPLSRWWRVAVIEKNRQGPFSRPQFFKLQLPAAISQTTLEQP